MTLLENDCHFGKHFCVIKFVVIQGIFSNQDLDSEYEG